VRQGVVDLASQPIRNRHPDPRDAVGTLIVPRWYGGGATTGVGVTTRPVAQTDGPGGIPAYHRKTWTTGPSNNGDTGYGLYAAAAPNNRFLVRPGHRVRFGAWMRASVDKIGEPSVTFYDAVTGGAAVGTRLRTSTRPLLKAGSWTWVPWVTPLAPAGAVAVDVVVDVQPSSGPDQATTLWVPGDTLDCTGAMVVTDGDATAPLAYADPVFLSDWRWTGTVNNSETVGYPSTLEGIAGRPDSMWDAAQVSGAGVALPADGAAVARWVDLGKKKRDLIQATVGNRPVFRFEGPRSRVDFSAQDRWLVTEVADVDMPVVGSWYAVIKYPPAQVSGVMALTAAPTQNTSPFYMSAASNPSYFSVFRLGNSNTPVVAAVHPPDGSRRVFSARLATNEIQMFVDSYASTIKTGAGTPFNAANSQQSLRMGTDTGSARDLTGDISFACVYEGVEHDAITRNRIMAWLARRYGTPVTAGY
jgi:hypothetical protein